MSGLVIVGRLSTECSMVLLPSFSLLVTSNTIQTGHPCQNCLFHTIWFIWSVKIYEPCNAYNYNCRCLYIMRRSYMLSFSTFLFSSLFSSAPVHLSWAFALIFNKLKKKKFFHQLILAKQHIVLVSCQASLPVAEHMIPIWPCGERGKKSCWNSFLNSIEG